MLSAKLTNEQRKAIYRRDHYQCALCDSPRGIQIHHVMKRSQGGSNSPHNLITLCMFCHNVAHGSRFPEQPDWMTPVEIHEACIEYLADYYAPNWYPWDEDEGP